MYRITVPEYLYSNLQGSNDKIVIPASLLEAPGYPRMQLFISCALWIDLLEYKKFRFLFYKTKYNTHILELEIEADLDSILMLKLKL